ncbi:MAG TPA: hypothetical protein VL689_19055 [Paraburkholderia sp.]|nr:hypothetical protein [Paraburkholderia sp.]
MTAESMHSARAGMPSRPSREHSHVRSRRQARLRIVCSFPMLVIACALAAACHDDDRATLSPAADAARGATSAAPLAQGVSAPPQTIAILASPAAPLKQAGADASPAAAPLAPPVIHTVD